MDLKTLKNEQQLLREDLLKTYADQRISILELSKHIKIAYTPIRSFLLGSNLGYANLLKVHHWLQNQKS